MKPLLTAAVFASLLAPTFANDHVVDASGAPGTYANLTDALTAASPGDTIFVKPGNYPSFHYFKSVKIIGLGTGPADVVLKRVDFHPTTPHPAGGYECLLQNVTLGDGSLDATIALTGNELPQGTLSVDGCKVNGGVFLRGGSTGFYALITNSEIVCSPGQGFLNAAVWFGNVNNRADIVRTRIIAANADPLTFSPAGKALVLAKGSDVRMSACEVFGGSGSFLDTVYGAGAEAIGTASPPGNVKLRVDGGTVVKGGDGLAGAAGGTAISLSGAVEIGEANVFGGSGTPPGDAYAGFAPTFIATYLDMQMTPDVRYASGPISVKSGESVRFWVDSFQPSTLMGISLDLGLPSNTGLFTPLGETTILLEQTNDLTLDIPSVPGIVLTGLVFYVQAAIGDPGDTNEFQLTNVASVRIDLF